MEAWSTQWGVRNSIARYNITGEEGREKQSEKAAGDG